MSIELEANIRQWKTKMRDVVWHTSVEHFVEQL